MVIRDRCLFRVGFNGILLLLVVGLFGLVFSLASSSFVSALTYSSSAELEFTFQPTLTVTFSPNTGFIIDNLSAGNSAYSNTVALSVDSNSSDGYILSATVGKTNDNNRNNNRLVHTNNTNYFEGIATNASLTLSNLGSNKWGYSTYDTTNEEWSDYSGLATVGNTGTTLLTTTSSGTTELDMKIGASAAVNQVAGAFTNDINFTATANVVTYDYTITFIANNSGTVTNMPTDITSASYNTGGIVQISPTIPTVNDYVFLGWCDGTVTGTTCTGTLYQPGDYIKLSNPSSSTTNAITLTGVWQFVGTLYMQDITDAQCQQNVGTNGNATNIGDNITVYDKRATSGNNNYSAGDDGDYTVRWINGACWMTQNLRIQGTVSATDSNFSSGSINVSQYDLKTNGSNECGSTDGYNNPCSRAPDSTDMSTIGSGVTAKEVGAWYNYYAASAGIISTDSNTTVASSDICPSGWHLPTGEPANTSSEFYKLFQSTSTDWINPNDYLTAFGAVKGGDYNTGSLRNATYGRWWSATASIIKNRYRLSYNSSNGQFYSSVSTRYGGNFVRCVKKNYMQDQTQSTLAAMMPNVGDTATLYDKRDEKSYTVAHLADGNYWMTQNLDHDIKTDGSVTYDSTTTDIPSAWTPSTATYATGVTTWGSSFTAPESYDPGDLCWNGTVQTSSGTIANRTVACGDDKHYHIGNYYNWTAAVAMNNSSSYTTQNTDVNQSICPAGWRLPIGGTTNTGSKSFQYLVDQLSLTSGTSGNIQNSPVYFVYGAYWYGSSGDEFGTYGYYWSSVVYDGNAAHSLNFGVYGQLYPKSTYPRNNGFPVRCVAR